MTISPPSPSPDKSPRRVPYVSLTSWASPRSLAEQREQHKPPRAVLHVVLPHGKSDRAVALDLTLDQCLALCANAADAARLLATEADG